MFEEQLSRQKKDVEIERRMKSILQSGNSSAILTTIEDIRKNGRTSVLPEVFNLLQETEDNEVIGACTALINDLNHEDSVPYLINAIKDKTLIDIRHHLVASCWQNGLDYSNYLDLFIELIAKDDYLVAIEAFTLIENQLSNLNDNQLSDLRAKLSRVLPKAGEEKKNLIQELIDIVQNY